MERKNSEWTAKAAAEEMPLAGEDVAPFHYAAVHFLDLKLPDLACQTLEYHSRVGGDADKEFSSAKSMPRRCIRLRSDALAPWMP